MTEVVDLTMTIDERTPTFPGDPEQEIQDASTVEEDGYAVKRLTFSSHFSTHLDAPAHMIPEGRTLDEYPTDRFVGDAFAVDVRGQEEISFDPGKVGQADMVLFRTGHAKKAYDGDYYQDNPVIAEETAEGLVDEGVDVVGIDSYSPDREPYPVHDVLLGNGVLIAENLVNLEAVSGERFRCYLLPLKITDADGAPCRAVGVVE